ncbi:MAG: serine/threonine transporter SstT [Gammaproteobacteria bacterium]|nr:MAG: serine/threonine transporter SstT [Gammaproteobacteria bacterium]|tara:strand:+ start:929 stop:2125 length:1197 start_codon:yes stop_codon:yes gene_type:complete
MTFLKKLLNLNITIQIAIGIIFAVILSLVSQEWSSMSGIFGQLFVQSLKAVAPVLVLFLVISALANQTNYKDSKIQPIVMLYIFGTFSAAFLAVLMSKLFPINLYLNTIDSVIEAPKGINEVLRNLLYKIVDNPINAIMNSNFIGILVWGILVGIGVRNASQTTKQTFNDITKIITDIVRMVIKLAPIGIFGLVSSSLAESGMDILSQYVRLILVLVGSMLIMALLINPIIVWLKTRRNPYPIVLIALKESGLTAFFTRSSAANIPVNLRLCEKLGFKKNIFAVSIPLGATINMGGAAITITILTLAATNTLGIHVDFFSALLLCIVSALSACGASGVAGGSLLLIPLSCGLFGISEEVAMQVVSVGFVISVLQDSTETALNSSTDVVFTSAVHSQNG